MKCFLGISDFLKEISSLSHSIVFLYFFTWITEEGFLISPCCSLELCIQMGLFFLFSVSFHFSFLSYLYGLFRQPFCLFAFLFLGDGLDYCASQRFVFCENWQRLGGSGGLVLSPKWCLCWCGDVYAINISDAVGKQCVSWLAWRRVCYSSLGLPR